MDFEAAKRRSNVATRRALAEHPESFELLIYLWAVARGQAAWLIATEQLRRACGCWALDILVFFRWRLDWIEVARRPSSTYFISMQTHAVAVLMAQMMVWCRRGAAAKILDLGRPGEVQLLSRSLSQLAF